MGRLKSIERRVWNGSGWFTKKEYFLTGSMTKDGYLRTKLTNNRVTKGKLLHRLVAEAFIDNPEDKPEVNHINEIKTDNKSTNLEWSTHTENMNHGTRSSRAAKTLSKTMKRDFWSVCINDGSVKYYNGINECRKDGFSNDGIAANVRGARGPHKGHTWFTHEPTTKEIEDTMKLKKYGVKGVNIKDGSVIRFDKPFHVSKAGFFQSSVMKSIKGEISQHKGHKWYFDYD